MDAQTIRSILGVVGLGMAGFVVQCEAKTTNWVWTNNTDATSAATAADWNDENNWDNGVPGEEDEAVFDSKLHSDQLVLPIERYVCIPEAGVKVGAITEKTGSVHLKFIGGPIRGLNGLVSMNGNYVNKLGPWLDMMFFCEVEGLDLSTTTTSGFYAPVSARNWAMSDTIRGTQVVMGRTANAPAPAVIENPFPTNVNNLACVGPIPREAQVLAGCVLTEGSKFVTCTENAARLLTAGAMVTCPDYLPEGTCLKAIYSTSCIELSQAPLASSAAATLNFAAYKPAVYQKMHLGNLNYTDGKTTNLVTRYQYFINPKNDFTIEFEGGLPPEATGIDLGVYNEAYTWEETGVPSSDEGANVAMKYIFPLSEGFAGMVTLGFGGAILSFPTNGQGRAGFSLDSRAQLYNRYGANTFIVPEDVETEPITTIIGGSSSSATKEGPGTLNMMMTADSANGKSWYLNQGGLCFGHVEATQSFSASILKPQKDVKVIAATNAHILITIIQGALPASVIEAREGSALEFTNASGIGYSASNLVVGAASTLSFLTYKNDDSVSAINLIIGGRQTVDDSAAVLNSKLLLSGGIGVALSAERKIPGKVVVVNSESTIPHGGVISIDNRFGRVPPGTYEILEVSGGDVPSDGKWICEPTVEGQKFSAKVVDGKLMLTAKGGGLVIFMK